MKLKLLCLIFLLLKTNELIYEKVADSTFSNAELINNTIIVSYNGGIKKYSYDLKLISEIPMDELILNSYSNIHQLDTNNIIIESSRAIYLIENDSIKYKINFDNINYFRQVLVINSNTYLVLKVELTTSIINYCLYNKDSDTPIKIEKSSKFYTHYTCNLSTLSNNNYIICFLVDDTGFYYNIFDSNLNIIKNDTIINTIDNNLIINSIYCISITDTKLILLLNSAQESPLRRLYLDDMVDKSSLIVFELYQKDQKFLVEKIAPDKDFIVSDKAFTGSKTFHMKKINEQEFVVVFPIDETRKEYYFSIFQYKNYILSVKEGYKNIPLSFRYEIQGLKFLKVNSDFAISFFYYNNEEEEVIQEVFISYLTQKKCENFEIQTYTNITEKLNFSKYISLDLISPDPDIQKMKINNVSSSSISFYYDNTAIDNEQFYGYENWNFNSGEVDGNFEAFYTVYSSNDYFQDTCKITFKLKKYGIEDAIKNKIEEMKKDFKKNSENNAIYVSDMYKISFYNTSKVSLDNADKREGFSNINNIFNCEKLLKMYYNIPDNQVLIIIQVELKRNDTYSSQVEYEIYSENFELLDLKCCKNEQIEVGIPYYLKNIKSNNNDISDDEITLEEKYKLGLQYNYDILSPNSIFYSDMCTLFDSEYSTDLIIEDRKKHYYLSQLFCEDNCVYSSYNITNKKVYCECSTKTEAIYNILFRKFISNSIDASFSKKIKNMNFKVLKCLGEGFKNISNNYLVWIMISVCIFFIIFGLCIIRFEKRKSNKIEDVKIGTGCELPQEGSLYTDSELAVMPYNLAFHYDKRDYFKMYLGTVKYNNIIWFTFVIKEYINNIFLKIIIFIYFISLLFLFNIFLYTDKDFTSIYLNKGKYDFGNEIFKALMAALICLFFNMILRLLLNDKKNKEKISGQMNNTLSINDTNIEVNNKVEKSYKKAIILIVLGILIFVLDFFYIVSFGSIFINTQKYLLIRIIYSLILSFIISFVVSLIYALLRYLGLKLQIEILYKVSLIIQNY